MGKVKKNKIKTHKGTRKILNIRQSGSITVGKWKCVLEEYQ